MLDEIRAKRDEIYAVARAHKAEKLWVFGSCARKEETPESDVDFLVKFNGGVGLIELVVFEKELYKGQIRSDLFNHPEFNHQKASESAEAELSEIKRLYTKVMGKRAFYNDLISEIISEDHNPDKDKLRANILKRLEIKGAVQEKKKKEAPDPKVMLIEAVCS